MSRKLTTAEAERFDDGVGDVEGAGFGIGLAPLGKAMGKISLLPTAKGHTKKKLGNVTETEEENVQNEPSDLHEHGATIIDQTVSSTLGGRDRKNGAPLSRAEEFECFKLGRGAEMSRILTENKCNCQLTSGIEKQKETGQRTCGTSE